MVKKITKKLVKSTNARTGKNIKTITVKNADGEPDTTATILVQNKISYTPKVSVIIPVYNVEKYLRECLDSVCNQTLKEIEIICVDDGSTDSSLDILKEYAKKDNRITVIGQQNLHAGVARNAGLAVARGEYLSFLDSDDFFETNMFEKMYNKAIETSAEICTCHVRIYNMSKNTYENCSWGLHDDLIPVKQPFAAKDIYEKIYQFNQGWVWDKIYKKSFVQKNKVRFQSQRSSNDVFFCFCNLTLATKIIVIPDALVTHRLHVKGSLENTREKSYFNIVNAVTKIKGFLEAKDLYKSVKVSFVNFAISNIIWNYETLKEPIKTFLLEYINKFYKELFNSINTKQYFNQANYEKMQNILNKRHMGNPADYIPVVLATNKNYCLPCVVTINSIIQNADKTKKYAVFVLHSELDNTDIEHLESMCTDNVFVHCISVDINRLVGNNFDYTTAHYSKEMYYRILIADMFGIYNKVIYIDCDLVLNTDIANLYQTDLCDNVIAAVINPVIYSTDYIKNTLGVEPEKYFNSGVLIINIKKFKELKIKERCLNLLQEIKSLRFPDQDVLNIACQGSVLYLDIRWNYQWFFKIDNIQLPTYCKEQYDMASSNPYIIHYSSGKKPWKMRNLRYAELWWKYAKGTPAYMFYAKQIDYKQELCDWYLRLKKENLNLDNPQTFNEKIQWLKLYNSTPEKTLLADKYLVRNWVAEKIGKKYLIPILGVYDSFDEIDFDKLPNQFVIKCNHGCGYNIIIKDKSKIDLSAVKIKLDKWMNENFAFRAGCELHYLNIPPKIIIEKYIENKQSVGGDLYDYKFWCFNGRVHYIQFLSERNTDGLKMAFYDKNWKKQDFVYSYPLDTKTIERPDNLDEMIELAEKLSAGFNHVRVDFYRMDDGTIYFGEMTFTSASGTCKWNDESINHYFGKLIELPKLAYNIDTGEYYKLPKTTPIKNKKNKTNRIKPYLLFPYYLLQNIHLKRIAYNCKKINNLPDIHADAFIPLGNKCRPAYHLKKHGLRKYSLPFDWMMNYSLDVIIDTLKNDDLNWFADFTEKDIPNKRNHSVQDNVSKMISLHHFPREVSVKEYLPIFNSIFYRRKERFCKILSESKHICFVMDRTESVAEILRFIKTLSDTYPKTQITLINVRLDNNDTSIYKYTLNKKCVFFDVHWNDVHDTDSNFKTNPMSWIGSDKFWTKLTRKFHLNTNVLNIDNRNELDIYTKSLEAQINILQQKQNNLTKQINEISVSQKNAANEQFATLSKQISDLEAATGTMAENLIQQIADIASETKNMSLLSSKEYSDVKSEVLANRQEIVKNTNDVIKAFATNADETKANIQSVKQDIEHTNNRISDTKKSVERNQVLYFNPWSTSVNAERGNCDMVSAPNFEERFKKLMAGLPDESAETVVKIIRRLQMIKDTNSALDLFTDEEKAQLKKVRDLNNETLKVSDNLYAYKNYMLPINHFEPSVFVYNHGISQLNSVDTFKDKDILDVGGFIGDSVLMLAPLTTGKVHSFEATNENYNHMLKTIELNGIKNAVPVHTAVGDKPGEIELRFNGSASSQNDIMVKNPKYVEKCPVITIDDYVREHNLNVGLIKVDIEGAEQSFLRGAYETIRTQKPTLLISIYHNIDDFLDIKPMIESWNLGYKFKIFKPTIESINGETLLICEYN